MPVVMRWRFRTSAAPPITPDPSPQWYVPPGLVRRAMSRTALDGTIQSGAYTYRAAGKLAGACRSLFVQFVSDDTLPPGELAGTLNYAVTWSDSAFQGPETGHSLRVRVVSADGSATRGVLYDGPGLPTVPPPSLADNKELDVGTNWVRGAALTPVTAQAGDRLVAEVGFDSTFAYDWPSHTVWWGAASDGTDLSLTTRGTDTGGRAFVELVLNDPPAPPGAPVGLAAVPGTDTADLTWTAPAAGGPVAGYEVRVDGGPPTAVGLVTAYSLGGLAAATAYTAEVRATGPGGASAWVPVLFTTAPSAAYRAVVRLGSHVWDVLAGDPPSFGPTLPVSFGWAVPEDALGFPAQPDPDLANLELVTADHADLAGVDIGTPMRVSLYTSTSPTARPLATFRGRVADMEATPHPLGLAWRVLGVGYDTDLGALQVGAAAWPQESGDARAARVMGEAGLPGWSAPAIGSTFEAREPAATTARDAMLTVANEAVSTEGTAFGPSRRVLLHPVTDDNGDLTAAPFGGAEVLRRVDALDVVSAGLVNRSTTWRRTKLLDATWVRIDHPGGPTTYGETRGPAYPPQSVSVTDPREVADLILDTTPGYRWLTGQPLRLELWADDGPALAVVSQWFYRDPTSPPFPWSGRAVLVRPVDKSPDGSATYAGMLTAATMRLEHDPARGGLLVVEFRLRPDIPAQSTVTMRWMDEPPTATWADELAEDPTGTWYDYYTTPRP